MTKYIFEYNISNKTFPTLKSYQLLPFSNKSSRNDGCLRRHPSPESTAVASPLEYDVYDDGIPMMYDSPYPTRLYYPNQMMSRSGRIAWLWQVLKTIFIIKILAIIFNGVPSLTGNLRQLWFAPQQRCIHKKQEQHATDVQIQIKYLIKKVY